MNCPDFQANQRFEQGTHYCIQHVVWRWYIDDACNFAVPLWNSTFTFHDISIFFNTVEIACQLKLLEASFSTKQLVYHFDQIHLLGVCIQLLAVLATNFVVCDELVTGAIHAYNMATERIILGSWKLYCISENLLRKLPIASWSTVITSSEQKSLQASMVWETALFRANCLMHQQ